jgi:4-hydroxybenzoate polyprenyltransferase
MPLSPAIDAEGRAPDAPPPGQLPAFRDFCSLPPERLLAFLENDAYATGSRRQRLWLLLMMGRPRTCVPGMLAYLLGFAYTGGAYAWPSALGSALSFFISFSANLHNTYEDVYEDSRNLPGRIYLLARLGRRRLLRCHILLSVVMLTGAACINLYFLGLMLLAMLGLHQYSAPPVRAKKHPVAGLWVFSQAVVFPFAFGWLTYPEPLASAGATFFGALFTQQTLLWDAEIFQGFRYLGMYFFLTAWFMAKGMWKNVPDYYGDRASGVRTSATAFASWRRAALATTVVTLAAYLSLGLLVLLGLESPRLLFCWLWLVPVALNCRRLVQARGTAEGNACLKADMILTCGFISTLLLVLFPNGEHLLAVLIGAIILVGSDLLGVDSRRLGDAAANGACLKPPRSDPFRIG